MEVHDAIRAACLFFGVFLLANSMRGQFSFLMAGFGVLLILRAASL